MSGPTFERTATISAGWKQLPRALHSLWDRSMQNQDGADVARALTHNLICAATGDEADALRRATELLQRCSPCRAFLLLLGDGEAGEAELAATTRCHGSVRDIVLEEIALPVARAHQDRIPGLLRPMVIDDLPSHLYWRLPWPGDERQFDRLFALCDTAVVDSARFGDPSHGLRRIGERKRQGERIQDLAWLRVQPWRRALAEAFERFPWRDGTQVAGTVVHGKAARATTILLADWLRERLSASMTIDPDGDAAAAGPDRVTLQVGDVEVVVERRGDNLVTHVTTAAHCYLPFEVGAERGSDAQLLAQAIGAS